MKAKKILSFILSLAMTVTMFTAFATTSSAEIAPTNYLTFYCPDKSFGISTGNSSVNWNGKIYYSTDLETWTEWDGKEIKSSKEKIGDNYCLYLAGKGNTHLTSKTTKYNGKFMLNLTAGYDLYADGDIMSLFDYDNPSSVVMDSYAMYVLFYNNQVLKKAPEISATTMPENCCESMFASNTNLEFAPTTLPATNLAAKCYYAMFSNCKKLTETPSLPATTIPESAYDTMFNSCTALTKTNLASLKNVGVNGCSSMFTDCFALTELTDLSKVETIGNGAFAAMYAATPGNTMNVICTTEYNKDKDCTRKWLAPSCETTATGWGNIFLLRNNAEYFSGALTIGKVLYVPGVDQYLSFENATDDKIEKSINTDSLTFTEAVTGAYTTVTYSSDNTDVAEVNSTTGAVTIKKAGTANITATAVASDDYHEATASYELTVSVDEPTFTTTADAGFYGADEETPETGVIAFTSFITNLADVEGITDFGYLYYYNESLKTDASSDLTTDLSTKSACYYSLIDSIATDDFNKTVVAKPFAKINGLYFYGNTFSCSVNTYAKWLGEQE